MIITIDGPTASGKSTTAQKLAQRLGFYYLNSGLLYRACAYLLLHNGYTTDTLKKVSQGDIKKFLDPARLTYDSDQEGNPIVKFDQIDITAFLKGSSTIDQASSIISTNGDVRKALLDVQRDLGKKHSLVIDGRDTGSIVFPHAEYKFYLTADLKVRAERWTIEQQSRGKDVSFDDACKQLEIRDKRDIERTIAPLRVPEGAIIIDNSSWSIEETVDKILMMVKK